jgi:hypothetical protein
MAPESWQGKYHQGRPESNPIHPGKSNREEWRFQRKIPEAKKIKKSAPADMPQEAG